MLQLVFVLQGVGLGLNLHLPGLVPVGRFLLQQFGYSGLDLMSVHVSLLLGHMLFHLPHVQKFSRLLDRIRDGSLELLDSISDFLLVPDFDFLQGLPAIGHNLVSVGAPEPLKHHDFFVVGLLEIQSLLLMSVQHFVVLPVLQLPLARGYPLLIGFCVLILPSFLVLQLMFFEPLEIMLQLLDSLGEFKGGGLLHGFEC